MSRIYFCDDHTTIHWLLCGAGYISKTIDYTDKRTYSSRTIPTDEEKRFSYDNYLLEKESELYYKNKNIFFNCDIQIFFDFDLQFIKNFNL
jgi:hypothetical protein